MSSGRRLRFLLAMAGAVAFLGVLPALEKQAVRNSQSLPGLVVAINLATIAALLVPGWRARPRKLHMRWADMLAIGIVASGIVVLLNIWALQTTSATHRSVFQAMYPAATAMFSYWLLRERLPVKTYCVIAAMIGGIIVMSSRGISLDFAPGDLLLFATLPLMGFSDSWVKKSMDPLSPAWVALCRFVFGTLFLLGLGLPLGSFDTLPGRAAVPWIVLSGMCVGGGILLLYRGIELRGASLASAIVGIAPVLTLLLEWAWLGATFTPIELGGMGVVVLGGLLLCRPDYQGPDADQRMATGRSGEPVAPS